MIVMKKHNEDQPVLSENAADSVNMDESSSRSSFSGRNAGARVEENE